MRTSIPKGPTAVTWWRRPYPWAIGSALAVLIINNGGMAVGDDGVGYVAIADNILAGKGLGFFLEPRLTIWPPGWPGLMAAVARITPLDTTQAAGALNAIVAFAIVVLVNRLLLRIVRDENLVLLGTAVAAFGASSMVFGHLLMTDLAFVAVTLALFVALLNFRGSDEFGWFVIAIVLVWVGFMIRYAGVINIATVGLWFLTDRRKTVAARLRIGVLFGVCAAVVPLAWIARNYSIDKTTFGVRYSSERGLIGNAYDMFATVGNFLVPGVEIEMRMLWAAVAAVGCLVMALLLWQLLRNQKQLRTVTGILDLSSSATGLIVIHVVMYSLYMLYARSTTGLNRLDFRLLNPMYQPLVLVGLAIIDRVIRQGTPSPEATSEGTDPHSETAPTPPWPKVARLTVYSWAGLNLLVGVAMIGYFATTPDLFVGNYERPAFDLARNSPALDALPTGCQVSSNLPNGLYESGVEAQWSPRETGLESTEKVDDLQILLESLDNDSSNTESPNTNEYCLVWVNLEPTYGNLYTLEELRQYVELVELASADGVTTYEIEPLNS